MNNKKFKKGIEEMKEIKMSALEKHDIFTAIAGGEKEAHSFTYWLGLSSFRVFASIVLFIALTSGTLAFAAEGSLPGDVLYPIKTRVTEPLRDTLANTPTKKANLEIKKTQKRLEEAETLSAEGNLDEKKEKQIEDLIDKHAKALNKEIDNTDDPDDIKISFEAEIEAHSKILESISSKPNRIKDIARIEPKKDKVNNPNKKVSRTKTRDSVNGLIKNVDISLDKTATSTSSVRNSIVENAHNSIKRAKESLDDVDVKTKNGDNDDAYSSLLDSERGAIEARILIEAGVRVDKQINKREMKRSKDMLKLSSEEKKNKESK